MFSGWFKSFSGGFNVFFARSCQTTNNRARGRAYFSRDLLNCIKITTTGIGKTCFDYIYTQSG